MSIGVGGGVFVAFDSFAAVYGVIANELLFWCCGFESVWVNVFAVVVNSNSFSSIFISSFSVSIADCCSFCSFCACCCFSSSCFCTILAHALLFAFLYAT